MNRGLAPVSAGRLDQSIVLFGSASSFALAALATKTPAMAIALALVVVFGIVFTKHPDLLIPATLVAAFTSVPDFVPTTAAFGGVVFRIYEPLLLISAVYVAGKYRGFEYRVRGFPLAAAIVLVGVIIGTLNSNPLFRVFTDVRPIVYLLLGYFVAYKTVRAGLLGPIARAAGYILWVSAAVTVLASLSGFGISNMQSEAAGSTDEVTRLIGPATYLAVAVLCGTVALAVSGTASLRAMAIWWVPSIPIAGLTFSRNILIAMVLALAFSLAAARSVRAIGKSAVLVASAAGVAVIVYSFVAVVPEIRAAGWLRRQADGYVARVLEGVGQDALAADASTQFRLQQENAYIIPKIAESPFWGHGFGYAYKPINTGRSFSEKSENLQYYAHNFYLWFSVKVGILALLILVIAVVAALVIAARQNGFILFSAGATVGIAGISLVAPMPLGNPTAVLTGSLAGGLFGMISAGRHARRRDAREFQISPIDKQSRDYLENVI